MSGKLTRDAFKRLIAEDIEWLRQFPNTLERRHIEAVLEDSIHRYYDQDWDDDDH